MTHTRDICVRTRVFGAKNCGGRTIVTQFERRVDKQRRPDINLVCCALHFHIQTMLCAILAPKARSSCALESVDDGRRLLIVPGLAFIVAQLLRNHKECIYRVLDAFGAKMTSGQR